MPRLSTRTRTAAVYLGLVVVPAVVAVVVLERTGGSGSTTPHASNVAAPTLVQLLLAIVVVIAACKLVGLLVRRIGQPPVVGEILAGILLGPSALGAVWPSGQSALLPPVVLPPLNLLAQLGVIFFVFLAGLELDRRLLRGRGRLAVVVSHVSVVLPFLLGIGLAVLAYATFAPKGIGFLAFALFMGVSMSVTALPVLVRVLRETGLHRSQVGVLALTCALVDDVTAWSLLALVVALTTAASLSGVAITVGLAAGFVALLFLAVGPLLAKLVRQTPATRLGRAAPLAVIGVLLAAMTTEWIGVHAMFGAFMLGLVFPRNNAVATWLQEKAGALTTALLLPLFFAYSGLRTNLTLLDSRSWLWCAAILTVAVVGKLGGSAVAARAVGEDWNRSLQIGVLMNCRGLTELIVLNVGLDLGVLSPTLFTLLVIMALVSTAMTAPMAGWFARRTPTPAISAVPVPVPVPVLVEADGDGDGEPRAA